jgi:crotonobetaine/carnitine-CoA ligase
VYADPHDPARWVLPAVIEAQADLRGDQPFVSMVDGDELSFRQVRDQAAQVAGMLAGLGAAAGDRIAIMLPNGLDFVRAWSGVGRLGAVAVLLNTELTGPFLAHPLADSAPRMLIIDAGYLDRLEDIRAGLPPIEQVVIVGQVPGDAPAGSHRFDAWATADPIAARLPSASDLACIMYTSGTSGPPKGVLMPHAHCYLFGLGVVDNLRIAHDDHYYICLPLYHANGLLMQFAAALIAGARATIRTRFSASAWLEDIRACGATVTHGLGAISAFVIARPASESDRDHALRLFFSAPNHPEHERVWRERFGIAEVLGGYGMTEVNIPLYGALGASMPGSCGRPYDRYFQVEIRDPQTDMPLARGEVGEIMVRPLMPGGFMAGYHGSPEKTVEAWRNFWFHTGDAGRMDADGYVTFIDRIKDCIRRRGENISATDIEASFADLPGLAEIAAFAVPSEIEGGEDEIMLALVPRHDAEISAHQVLAHAQRRIPRFAQPRYLEFRTSLPKTGSEKVRKVELRHAGVSARTIDLGLL